jgi:hypothetical protein
MAAAKALEGILGGMPNANQLAQMVELQPMKPVVAVLAALQLAVATLNFKGMCLIMHTLKLERLAEGGLLAEIKCTYIAAQTSAVLLISKAWIRTLRRWSSASRAIPSDATPTPDPPCDLETASAEHDAAMASCLATLEEERIAANAVEKKLVAALASLSEIETTCVELRVEGERTKRANAVAQDGASAELASLKERGQAELADATAARETLGLKLATAEKKLADASTQHDADLQAHSDAARDAAALGMRQKKMVIAKAELDQRITQDKLDSQSKRQNVARANIAHKLAQVQEKLKAAEAASASNAAKCTSLQKQLTASKAAARTADAARSNAVTELSVVRRGVSLGIGPKHNTEIAACALPLGRAWAAAAGGGAYTAAAVTADATNLAAALAASAADFAEAEVVGTRTPFAASVAAPAAASGRGDTTLLSAAPGLANAIGENNCFANVCVYAFCWRYDGYRTIT